MSRLLSWMICVSAFILFGVAAYNAVVWHIPALSNLATFASIFLAATIVVVGSLIMAIMFVTLCLAEQTSDMPLRETSRAAVLKMVSSSENRNVLAIAIKQFLVFMTPVLMAVSGHPIAGVFTMIFLVALLWSLKGFRNYAKSFKTA